MQYPVTRVASASALRQLSNTNVLVYFPHGLGDIVMFNATAKFLAVNNNRLFFTRCGDDYVAAVAGSRYLTPIYSGVRNVHTGDCHLFGAHHLGLMNKTDYITVTRATEAQLLENKITHLYWEHFPEPHSGTTFPFHSKPRACLPQQLLTAAEIEELQSPLDPGVDISTPPPLLELVKARLQTYTSWTTGAPLIIITRYGMTAVGKNWGHLFRSEQYPAEGDEAREFIRLCRQKNDKTVFITMEHSGMTGPHSLTDHAANVFNYAELFAAKDTEEFALPYALVVRALFSFAKAHVGVPTGATGIAQMFPHLRNVALWIEGMPSRYFEPYANTYNLVSNNQLTSRLSWAHSFQRAGKLHYQTELLDTPNVPGSVVYNFMEDLL